MAQLAKHPTHDLSPGLDLSIVGLSSTLCSMLDVEPTLKKSKTWLLTSKSLPFSRGRHTLGINNDRRQEVRRAMEAVRGALGAWEKHPAPDILGLF